MKVVTRIIDKGRHCAGPFFTFSVTYPSMQPQLCS